MIRYLNKSQAGKLNFWDPALVHFSRVIPPLLVARITPCTAHSLFRPATYLAKENRPIFQQRTCCWKNKRNRIIKLIKCGWKRVCLKLNLFNASRNYKQLQQSKKNKMYVKCGSGPQAFWPFWLELSWKWVSDGKTKLCDELVVRRHISVTAAVRSKQLLNSG